jgi:predicted Zn-dependent peptidase
VSSGRLGGGPIHSAMPYQFAHTRLANGLQVISESDPSAHSAAAGFFVKTGARDEAAALMGVSHFLEHMMFKGTAEMTAEELNRRFDAIGARNNAFTSNEMTCFHAHVLPEYLPEATGLLARMLRPALHDADFQTERGVILEEIAMYQDNPFWVLYEAAVERHFGTHALSHRVLGTPGTISAMRRDQMRAYFDSRYSADNTVVAFAGRLDHDRVCGQVGDLCREWKPTGVGRSNAKPALAGGEFELRSEKVTRGYVIAICDAPAMDDPRRYAAALLAQILGAPDNSRLHWRLVESGLAEDAQASFDAHDGFGDYLIFASGDAGALPAIWGAIRGELDAFAGSLEQADLDRLVEKVATGITVGGERPQDRMQRLGRLWTYLGEYRTLNEELERMRAVTVRDLRECLAAFPVRPVTVGRLLPAEGAGA